jgi:hypothetical protein
LYLVFRPHTRAKGADHAVLGCDIDRRTQIVPIKDVVVINKNNQFARRLPDPPQSGVSEAKFFLANDKPHGMPRNKGGVHWGYRAIVNDKQLPLRNWQILVAQGPDHPLKKGQPWVMRAYYNRNEQLL